MNGRRTLAIAKKVLRSLKHDPRSIALMLVAPILAMAIFGFAFGSDLKHVPLAVVNEDAGPAGARIVSNLDGEALDVHTYGSIADAQQALRDAKVRGILHLPAGFSAGLQRGSATIDLRLDGSNAQFVAHIGRQLQLAMEESITQSGARIPVTVQSSYVYAQDAKYIDFFVPGIMAFAAMMFTTLLTLLAFVGERTSGTLTRLLATPVRGSEIVGGYAIAFGLVAAIQGAILLTVALLLFHVLLVGSLVLAFGIVILVAIDAMSLGILLSAAAKRELQAVQMIPLVIFPTFLLSGIFVPVETLPSWLRPFSWLIPPTYAVEALRDIMLRGWALDRVWPYVLGLAGFGVLFLGLASWRIEAQRARPKRRGGAGGEQTGEAAVRREQGLDA
ncbi:MAG TPA: ABC transporter permease [Candidatus Thermoplasmatota archaeon]|nr:ABC transporter permease [Candidatus Thermoplasmatota archaeon]